MANNDLRMETSLNYLKLGIYAIAISFCISSCKGGNDPINDEIIKFADAVAKELCVKYFDKNKDGELSRSEAAAVTDTEGIFFYVPIEAGGLASNYIISFNEFQYFTSLSYFSFMYQKNLKEIILPPNITFISNGAFDGCSSLTSVTIPNSVTSIGDIAFNDCHSLTSINIPNGVTSIGNGAFEDCHGLTSINLPNGLTSIGDGVFQNCSSLTNINIPDEVTSIGRWAFSGCGSLTNINIPDKVTSIGEVAFGDCSSLTNINIRYGVTSIGEYAFFNCDSLTSINIPDGVTSIGFRAFNGCSSLTSITFLAEFPPKIGDGSVQQDLALKNGVTIYVPSASLERYKSDPQWEQYADQIKAIQ